MSVSLLLLVENRRIHLATRTEGDLFLNQSITTGNFRISTKLYVDLRWCPLPEANEYQCLPQFVYSVTLMLRGTTSLNGGEVGHFRNSAPKTTELYLFYYESV
jgi:hypothetical protein